MLVALGSQTLVRNPSLVINEWKATLAILLTLGDKHGMNAQHVELG